MTDSLEDSFPCIMIDPSNSDVGDDSVLTFCASFLGDSNKSLSWLESSPVVVPSSAGESHQRWHVPRMPRRRQTLLVSDNLMTPPRRRSTKSTKSMESCASEVRRMERRRTPRAQQFIHLGSAQQQQSLPCRKLESLERFEEPKPPTSLGLPALPMRQQSLISLSSQG
jgi:hypothetical protein